MTGGPPHNELKTRRELESPGVRWITFGVISTLHLLIIGGMFLWGCRSTEKLPEKPKEKKYKVKLQAAPPPAPPSEPTVAPPPPKTPPPPKPVVTPQEPVVAPPPPKPQPPKEPVVKPPPKKKPPKKKPLKKKPPREPVVKPPKKQPSKKNPPREPVVRPPKKQPPKQQTTQNIRKPPKTKEKPKDFGIYQPPTTGKKFDPKGKYNSSPTNRGSNPNARPSKNTGADDTRENQDWIGKVSVDVYNNWTPPEGVFWGGGKAPQATIELTIAADGRVLSSKLVRPSGNARMDASIREMLRVLTRVTRPPHGGQTILVELIPE